MPNRPLVRAAMLPALVAASGLGLGKPVIAGDPPMPTIEIAASESQSRFVSLGIGKSVVIDLPRDVKDVLVADPKTANAVIRSARRAYLIGLAAGPTTLVFFDTHG